MIDVTSVIVGPDQHGVVRHAVSVAGATSVRIARHCDVAACRADPPASSAVYHWHFTDRLFGVTVEDAAAAFVDLTAKVSGRHVVTMHDVPAPGASERDRRRAAAYHRVACCCRAVVVASEHERQRLAAIGIDRDVDVVPLPVVAPAVAAAGAPVVNRPDRTLGILGFIYPGKGHADVLAASVGLPDDVSIVAIGRPSDGHDDLVADLRRAARVAGRRLLITGFLEDADLSRILDDIDVPIVPAGDVSASASVAAWIAAWRRPLVVDNAYHRELAAIAPGLTTRYRPNRLPSAILAALADPASTRRTAAVPTFLGLAAVAAAHDALYRRVGA